MSRILTNIDTITVIKLFKAVAECIEPIKSYSYGTRFDPNKSVDLVYPHLFIEVPTRIDLLKGNTTNSSTKTVTVGFQVLTRALDGVNGQKVEEDAITESSALALSNTETLALEIYAVLKRDFGRSLNDAYTLLPLIEAYEDKVYGWRCEVQFKGTNGLNNCNTPTTSEDECASLFDNINLTPGITPPKPCPDACLELINENSEDIVDLQNQIDNIEIDVKPLLHFPSIVSAPTPVWNEYRPFDGVGNISGNLTSLPGRFFPFRLEKETVIYGIKNRAIVAPATTYIQLALYDSTFITGVGLRPNQRLEFDNFEFTPGVREWIFANPITVPAGYYWFAISNGPASSQWHSIVASNNIFYNASDFQPVMYFSINQNTGGGALGGGTDFPVDANSNTFVPAGQTSGVIFNYILLTNYTL